MAKVKKAFFCQNCGSQHTQWQGQCNTCKEWNTLVEEIIEKEAPKEWASESTKEITSPIRMDAIDVAEVPRIKTQDEELNRVLGGGLVPRDSQTKKAIKEIYEISGYIADPHGAIGYLGLKEFLESTSDAYQGLFFETAHPIKFVETVENTLKTSIEVPERLKGILNRKKESVSIQTYEQLKSFLLES